MKGCPHMVWALYRPDLAPAERNILVHMANVATSAMMCFDSMAKIGRLFGMSVRSVHRCISELERKNYIERQRRFRQPNVYLINIPTTEAGKRDRQPAPGCDGDDISTQPLNGDKSGHAQPLNGDKTCMSTPANSAKNGQNGPSYSAKLAQEESLKREESPKEAQQADSFSGEGSKQAADEPKPEPEVERNLDGLSPLIAAIARRNGWGEPVAAPVEPEVVMASVAEAADLPAETGAPAEIAAAVGKILRRPFEPEQRKVNKQVEMLNGVTPRPRPKAAYVTGALRDALYADLPIKPIRQPEYA